MYLFGQILDDDIHFLDHMGHRVPVQIYHKGLHKGIGIIQYVSKDFIKIDNFYYSRKRYTFVSRPGY